MSPPGAAHRTAVSPGRPVLRSLAPHAARPRAASEGGSTYYGSDARCRRGADDRLAPLKAMPDVTLRRENERELVFANRPSAALAVGFAFAVSGYAVWALLPDRRRWFLLAVALVAVVISAAAALRRERLVLDLANGRYRRETGYWPRIESRTGSLAEVEHVELVLRSRARGLIPLASRRQQPYWMVSLKFRGREEPYALLEERNERVAYNRFEALARKLRVPALDRTGGEDRLTPWAQVDRP